MDLIPSLLLRALVGKMEFVQLSRANLLDWVREQWNPFIQNVPKVLALVNGWYLFHFLSEDDRKAIEKRYKVHGKGSLVLSIWNVHFDPRSTKLEK